MSHSARSTAESAAQFGSGAAEGGHAFVEKSPVAFDGRRIGSQQSGCHPVVNDGRRRLRDVVGLAVPDDRLAVDCAGVGMHPEQQKSGHDIRGDDGLDRGDTRPTHEGMRLRRPGGTVGPVRLWQLGCSRHRLHNHIVRQHDGDGSVKQSAGNQSHLRPHRRLQLGR